MSTWIENKSVSFSVCFSVLYLHSWAGHVPFSANLHAPLASWQPPLCIAVKLQLQLITALSHAWHPSSGSSLGKRCSHGAVSTVSCQPSAQLSPCWEPYGSNRYTLNSVQKTFKLMNYGKWNSFGCVCIQTLHTPSGLWIFSYLWSSKSS